ncbi:hypothetical protein [Novosphingobium resinovorum]|nr:hypothetical protein [Novosphingobium resinovorum]
MSSRKVETIQIELKKDEKDEKQIGPLMVGGALAGAFAQRCVHAA